jgi:ribose transport system substrate-binding protein
MRRFGVTTLAAAMVLVGCNGGGSSTTSPATDSSTTAKTDGARLQIAVIPKGATHEYWKSLHEGADKAGKEFGVDIIWKSSVQEDDREGQIKVVEDFVTKGVSGIVLAPLDATALKGPVVEAQNSKIPVVIIDSAVNGVDTVSFVATDNEKGGHIAGAELARLLNGKGKVVMLRYQVGSASTEAREKGFLDEIKKSPGIQIVSDNQYGGATVESAQKASENLLAPLKKADGSLSIDGIYTPNESTAFGMLRVLQDSGQAGKVHFVGFDANPKLIDGLKAGQIDGLVVQNPRNMGYLGVKAIVDSIHGKPVDKRIDTGATLVTKANLSDPTVAELIAPPKE